MSTLNNACVTNLEITKHTFKWKINNFKFHGNGHIHSPIFTNDSQTNWCLILHNTNLTNGKYLSFMICRVIVINSEPTVKAVIKICLIDYQGIEINAKSSPIVSFPPSTKYDVNGFMKWDDFESQKSSLYPDDCLTVYCEIILIGDIKHSTIQQSEAKYMPLSYQPLNFEKWLNSGELADITLAIGDNKFKAHKIMLAAQSPVFAAMFKHHTTETINNIVTITDMSQEALTEFLSFIYTGRVDTTIDIITELLAVADKYDVPHLKAICETVLIDKLSVDNAIEYFVPAYLHSCKALQRKVVKLIVDTPDILSTEKWNNLLKSPHSIDLLNLIIRTQLIKNSVNSD